MPTDILSCGYAYHVNPFYMGGRSPLSPYIFRLQTTGSSRTYIGGEMRDVQVGDLLLFKPGDLYDLRIEAGADGQVKSGDYYMICLGDWLDRWWHKAERQVHYHIGDMERIVALWKMIILEKRRVGERESELNGSLLQSLCLYFDLAYQESDVVAKPSYIAHRMKRYVDANATDPFTVDEVARQVGLSGSRAAHLFKETFGESIMQYALKVRLAIAVERIKYSTNTLEQIAATCGLGSYPYFHRVFKANYGEPPSVFRQRWLAEVGGYT